MFTAKIDAMSIAVYHYNTYDVGQLYVTVEIAVLLAYLILNEGRSQQRVCTSYWQELL